MIEAKGICFHYKNCPVVLQNVDFQAEDGHFLAILGNNGAGKSTLLKCMNGILKPDAGSLLLALKKRQGGYIPLKYTLFPVGEASPFAPPDVYKRQGQRQGCRSSSTCRRSLPASCAAEYLLPYQLRCQWSR